MRRVANAHRFRAFADAGREQAIRTETDAAAPRRVLETMSPYDLRLARRRLGMTQAGMARELGMGGRTYRRMEQAGEKVSGPVAVASPADAGAT